MLLHQRIQRACCAARRHLQHMGVNHCRARVAGQEVPAPCKYRCPIGASEWQSCGAGCELIQASRCLQVKQRVSKSFAVARLWFKSSMQRPSTQQTYSGWLQQPSFSVFFCQAHPSLPSRAVARLGLHFFGVVRASKKTPADSRPTWSIFFRHRTHSA